jgi:crotonobetainyl-CoA:carnitine CoA-transferase CaiB-like acyl-CoA transferase
MSAAPWSSLAGVRVLEIGQNIAGPWAGTILANFGATVIKVEALSGDPVRKNEPRLGDASAPFAAINAKKQYLALDLKRPEARPIIARLLAHSDVLIQNLRPGRADRFGLGAEEAHAINPALIHCSISAFYPTETERPGYDVLAQAESGLMSLTGEADRRPSRIPVPVLDYSTGMWAALAILSALHGERHNLTLRVSLLDVAVGLLNDMAMAYMFSGCVPQRLGSQVNGVTPHGAYSAADGDLILSSYTDEHFRRLCRLLGPPVDGDDRYQTLADRVAHRPELDAAINEVLQTRSTAEWVAALDDVGIPVAVIRSMPEALERHEKMSATGFRPFGDASVLAPPVEAVGLPWEAGRIGGSLGQDTRPILESLGFDADDVERFIAAGVVV